MSVKSAFSVTKALRDSAGFLPRAWSGAWLALGLLFAVVGGAWLTMHHLPSSPLACVALIAVILVLKYVAHGSLYRIALFGPSAKDEGLGFGGVQIGRPERRLFLASLAIAVFFVMIAVTVFIVFAIALSLSGLAQGYGSSLAAVQAIVHRHAGADVVFILYLIAASLFLIFVAVKFSLASAANIGQRRLVTLNALGLTSGNVGKLTIGIAIIVAPFVLVTMLATFGPFYGRRIVHFVLIGLNVLVLLPLIVGFFASAYRQIVTNRFR
ncbi:hypothetical protein AEAC466_09180 [Asticcacaulis sp. AC466]|uniref:hypothetical protein n=1 Tax=Asticcacaulis sp. AC466 TaxID=1282362 RepID=UPI0003C3BFCD|nr:hypothetical protein [Asticcacaulis sp. AC466]ESQ84514.1 hypothetical protein AEAC466_09180 [Asticcacaulis sp. AC466]